MDQSTKNHSINQSSDQSVQVGLVVQFRTGDIGEWEKGGVMLEGQGRKGEGDRGDKWGREMREKEEGKEGGRKGG